MPKSILSRAGSLLNVRIGRRAVQPLLFLVTIDIVFMVVHFLHKSTPILPATEFDIAQDRSYAEFFQYAKTLILSIFLWLLCYRQRSLIYGFWAAVFAFIFVDDAFELHEQIGTFLVNQFTLPALFNLRPQDIGEMLIYAAYAVTILTGCLVAHYYDRDKIVRQFSLRIFSILVLLGIFGCVVDFMHVQVVSLSLPKVVVGMFTLAEDGGEMLVVSLLLWFVGLIVTQAPQSSRSPVLTTGTEGSNQHPNQSQEYSGSLPQVVSLPKK